MSKKLIETLEFNNTLHAQKTIEKTETSMKKIKRALIPAAISTTAFLYATMGGAQDYSVSGFLMTLSMIGSIVSYIMGGGFKIALKTAGKLAVVGWFFLPFPIDIVTGICTMIFAVIAFFFMPLVFVYLNYRQHKKNLADAKEYLECCVQKGSNDFNYENAAPVDYIYPDSENIHCNETTAEPEHVAPVHIGAPCPPPFVG